MKRILAGILIIAISCVLTPSVGAQQRDRDRGQQRSRSSGRGDRGRGQRQRRYRGGQWEWYESPAVGGAVGSFFGNLLRQKEEEEEPEAREPVRDIAWCIGRYKSYNPKTQQYLGYDGKYHDCP